MRDRQYTTRTFAWTALLGAALLLAACDLDELVSLPREVSLAGVLLDDDGAAWADATVYVVADDGAQATSLTRNQSAEATCDEPGTTVVVWGCTDADGRFSLAFTTQQSQFDLIGRKNVRVLRVPFELPATLVPGAPTTVDLGDRRLPDLDPVEDLRSAIAFALPGLNDYSLVPFPDEKVVVGLQDAMQVSDGSPRYVGVPLRDADGTVLQQFQLTVYHHDLRLPEAATCPSDVIAQQVGDALGCAPVAGPSRTFQGVPVWTDDQLGEVVLFPEEYEPLFIDSASGQLREDQFQPSVVSLIDEGRDGSMTSVAGFYFGPGLASPSGFQSLRSVLETVIDPKLTERLVESAGPDTYLVFSLADYDVPDEHGDHPIGHPDEDVATTAHEHGAHSATLPGVQPLAHVGTVDGPRVSRLVAQMVADTTIYDRRRTNPLVQPSWFSRADHSANVQDMAFTWLQIYGDAPSALTTLEQWSNAFILRTRVGRYWALTEASARDFEFPANSCVTSPSLVNAFRERSPASFRDDTLEFWGWWTNTTRYATFNTSGVMTSTGALGCAYVGTMGNTGRERNVSWTHLSFQTLDNTAATFVHETGHLINGSHATNATIRSSHRCRLIGIFPVGPTGPSLHHRRIAGTERTLCFARTEAGDTAKRNMTRVAEYLHGILDGVP